MIRIFPFFRPCDLTKRFNNKSGEHFKLALGGKTNLKKDSVLLYTLLKNEKACLPKKIPAKILFSAAKFNGYKGVEEELFIRNQVYLGYFAEIKLASQAYFYCSDRLIESAIIKTQGSFCIDTGFETGMAPSYK